MAEYEKIWEKSIPAEHGGVMYSASIRVRLHGKWSGNKVTGTPQSQDDRTFKLKITGSYIRATIPQQSGEMWTSDEWYCSQNNPNSDGEVIYAICVDDIYNSWNGGATDGHLYLNFFRRARERATSSEDAQGYTACEEITETGSHPGTGTNEILQYVSMAQTADMSLTHARLNPTAGLQWCYNLEYDIETDLPIFETEAQLMNYINSDGEDTSDIVNVDSSPEEEYLLDKKSYWIHNIFQNRLSSGVVNKYWRNYRWKPGYDSKIRLYHVDPTVSRPYNWVLVVPGGLTRYKGPKGEYNDDDAFVEDEDALQTHYLSQGLTFERTGPDKNIWDVSDFDTNIPKFANVDDATDYANDIIGIEDALNYQDILRYENEIVGPDYGDADASTETGVNGQTYFAGSCIYALSRSEMIQFFTEIFKVQDPAFINAFKAGNVLFGDNQANAIIGCMYFPFDVTDVCSLESSSGAIWVGGWQSQTATGKKVQFNDKVLTIGEFQMTDIFKDVRDYEPYTNLYVQLPYCGTYQLQLQKYLNKLVTIKYAVDIFSGACMALIYGNGILLDTMDGMIGSQRPVTGRTAANIMSSITGGITGATAGAKIAAGGGAMLAANGGAAALQTNAVIQGAVMGATQVPLTQAGVMGMAGTAGGLALGAAGVAGAAAAGTYAAYGIKNAYADPPMNTRGSYGGNMGMFSNQKVHFIVAIRHTERPENELDLIGYPSGRSGKIGEFSGFLKSSMVYLADGFIGSSQERDEILQMISKGIYV